MLFAYFFLFFLVCDSALPAADFDVLLVRLSFRVFDAALATLSDVCFFGAFRCDSALPAAVFDFDAVDLLFKVFDALLAACIDRAYGVVCLGQLREKLFGRLVDLRGSGRWPHLLEAESLEEAVKAAAALAEPGQSVLLSPGCASYDMFANFDHRGRVFAQIVRSLP